MPKRTYITAEANTMPGHKPMKDLKEVISSGEEEDENSLGSLPSANCNIECLILRTNWDVPWVWTLAVLLGDVSSQGEKLEYSLAAQAVRRSRRLQGLEPQENIAMIKQETQTKMGEYHFQPFRNPSIFTGERNQNPEKWLKEFHRVARYNCWMIQCASQMFIFSSKEQRTDEFRTSCHLKKINSQRTSKLELRGREETSDSYIQDVLHLCREVNPAMMENEIVAHLTKGISGGDISVNHHFRHCKYR
ncbi:hypothetical protein LAZ67_13001818 [Cordylochernes scorpioides]|uniref:Uncharacterized protein n=1 Tax=Cordylochernes scorpioides TaxID=51811 RepID=A0ABY6L835_9ARAC|nr:hypothetical protein LAZ67_13001818 [Cordylochernes scorpioides]